MIWRKLGQMFDPRAHKLANHCLEFAQSPQALVLSDRVRVYFSTRERDDKGKYLSHVAFVDFDKSMRLMVGLSKHTILSLGGLGSFDEHGIFPFNVAKHDGAVLAYTTGWSRRVSVSVETSIGLAVSHDEGMTFQRHGSGPIMSSSLHEPFLVADAFVASFEGMLHMWYIFGTKWQKFDASSAPDRVYKIAHATSEDGITWRRDGKPIIADRLNENECQALPSVFYRNGAYHLYFCYRQAHGFRSDSHSAYRIGYARSENLREWIRDDANAGIDVSGEGWDSRMQCYPHTFEADGTVYMLYNGNEFGRFGFGLAVLEN